MSSSLRFARSVAGDKGRSKTSLLLAGLSALAVLALAPFSPAHAVEYKIQSGLFGGVSLFVDSNLSAGASMRVQGRKDSYLPSFSGGPNSRTQTVIDAYLTGGGDTAGAGSNGIQTTGFIGNHRSFGFGVTTNDGVAPDFAGGVNTDAGRLNFDKGNLIGAPVKILTDITASRGRWTIFARVNAFYDAVLADKRSYKNNPIDRSEAIDLIGRDFELLDGYLSGDFDVLDYPLNVRVGKQVINWGESTFYLSGNSVAGSVDLTAARRPGAELKEILLPENAVFASLGLPYDTTLEAYYLLDSTPYELDPSGSPFANGDITVPGNSRGDVLQLSGSPTTGVFRHNCSGSPGRRAAAALGIDLPALPEGPCRDAYALATAHIDTLDNPYQQVVDPDDNSQMITVYDDDALTRIQTFRNALDADADNLRDVGELFDYRVSLTPGQSEDQLRYYVGNNLDALDVDLSGLDQVEAARQLRSYRNLNVLERLPDLEASEDGQYGLAVRWYSDSLNGTEFGFYYQNVHSKLPIAEVFYYERPVVTTSVTGVGSAGGAQLVGNGCGFNFFGNGVFRDDADLSSVQRTVGDEIADPIGGTFDPDIRRLNLSPVYFREAADQDTGVAGDASDDTSRPGLEDYLGYARFADKALYDFFTLAGVTPAQNIWDTNPGTTGSVITDSAKLNGPNRYDVSRINCALAIYNTGAIAGTIDGGGGSTGAVNGAEYLGIQHRNAIRLYYPEDITVLGFSFATTLGDWGIQGDFAWRLDQPLQVDVTEQIIHAAGNQSTGLSNGDVQILGLTPLGTQGSSDIIPSRYKPELSINAGLPIPGTTRSVRADLGKAVIAVYEGCDEYGLAGDVDESNMDDLGFCHSTNLIGGRPDVRPVSVLRTDVYSLNLSAVNTFTASNWLVNLLGGDLGVALAEAGFIYVPGAPDPRAPGDRVAGAPVPTAPKYPTLAALCRSGSEMPLGGLLNLDPSNYTCSPDRLSWGYTLLGIIDHSNFWGSAWTVRTQASFSAGVSGNTPSPFPGFRENAYTAGLQFIGSYQSEWELRFTYTNYFGNSDYQNSSDRDFIGVSASYTF